MFSGSGIKPDAPGVLLPVLWADGGLLLRGRGRRGPRALRALLRAGGSASLPEDLVLGEGAPWLAGLSLALIPSPSPRPGQVELSSGEQSAATSLHRSQAAGSLPRALGGGNYSSSPALCPPSPGVGGSRSHPAPLGRTAAFDFGISVLCSCQPPPCPSAASMRGRRDPEPQASRCLLGDPQLGEARPQGCFP